MLGRPLQDGVQVPHDVLQPVDHIMVGLVVQVREVLVEINEFHLHFGVISAVVGDQERGGVETAAPEPQQREHDLLDTGDAVAEEGGVDGVAVVEEEGEVGLYLGLGGLLEVVLADEVLLLGVLLLALHAVDAEVVGVRGGLLELLV